MNDHTEARLRADLAAVDTVSLMSLDDVGAAVTRVQQRSALRRRLAVGTATVALVAAAAGAAWIGSGAPESVTEGDGGSQPTQAPATASTATEATGAATTEDSGTTTSRLAPTTVGERWEALPPSPLGSVTGAQVVWTGSEAVIVGGLLQDGRQADGVAAFDPVRRAWRTITTEPTPLLAPLAVWTGDSLLAVGWSDHVRTTSAVTLDLATGEWSSPVPMPFGYKSSPSNPHAWTGSEFLLWAGDRLMMFASAAGWTERAAPPIESRYDAATGWTGTEWIVWGGGATDGDRALGDGTAYDPATDRWRVLADSPLRSRMVSGVWTGTELLVYAGRSSNLNGMFAFADGAGYDPATDSWRPMHDGPAHPGFEAVYTPGRLFVFAKGGMSSYDVVADSWDAPFESAGVCFDASSPVWTGESLLLLGCYDGSTGGAAFTPPS
ncbi:MAG: hypothetical protein Q7V88_01860 [Actinomycetota bacterium]|nr:hypothetical protein [Actinomycetota bacterium]